MASNLYRALRLRADASRGQLVPSLAREGGLQSTLWAGPERVGRAVKTRITASAGIDTPAWQWPAR